MGKKSRAKTQQRKVPMSSSSVNAPVNSLGVALQCKCPILLAKKNFLECTCGFLSIKGEEEHFYSHSIFKIEININSYKLAYSL